MKYRQVCQTITNGVITFTVDQLSSIMPDSHRMYKYTFVCLSDRKTSIQRVLLVYLSISSLLLR
jgi:hypothetical protein